MSFSPATLILTTGCGENQRSNAGVEEASESSFGDGTTENRREAEIIREIETIFQKLSNHPLVDTGEVVFDLSKFEDDFDHEGLLNRANTILRRIETELDKETRKTEVQSLVAATEVAKLLIRQRVIVHQFITACLTGRAKFYQTVFDQAIEDFTNAMRFLVDLERNGHRIHDKMSGYEYNFARIENFDPDTIQEVQKVLIELVYWSIPAVEGLEKASSGMKWFMKGHKSLDENRYGGAAIAYEKSYNFFEEADEALSKILTRGRRFPHIARFVDRVRCLLPAYLTGSDQLIDSMDEFETGNEKRAKAIAKDALDSAKRKSKRCS